MERKRIDRPRSFITRRSCFLYAQQLDSGFSCSYNDVIECGADASGTVDSTQAFEFALLLGACLLVPAGKYVLSDDMLTRLENDFVYIPQVAVEKK